MTTPNDMRWVSYFFFCLAALLHICFFIIESYLIQKKSYAEKNKISELEHSAMKPWAFNQGFYNLALALQMIIGLIFVVKKEPKIAGLLVGFSGLTMILAGVVLFFSVKKLRKAALVQIIPPLLGFLFLMFHIIQ